MCDMNEDFLNALCEHVYGDEYTKYDTKNILRNLKPAYEGTGILKIGTIKNSQYFFEFVLELWEQLQDLKEWRRRYKKQLKTDKDYNTVCDLLQKEKIDCQSKILEIREECDKIVKGSLDNCAVHNKLKYDYKHLCNMYKNQERQLEDQDLLKGQLNDSYVANAEIELKFKQFYQEQYEKDKKELDKECDKKIKKKEQECDKKIKEYVRQDDKICNMEKNEKIKKLEKQVKNLQQQLIQTMD